MDHPQGYVSVMNLASVREVARVIDHDVDPLRIEPQADGLANEFDENGYRAIRHAFHQLSGTQIALTALLGLASYACLIGFDAIGLRRSGRRLHPARPSSLSSARRTPGRRPGPCATPSVCAASD